MNGRFQMQGGKNWILPKEMNANRFFWDSHWLEIWSNHFCPSMGPNGGIVAMDSAGKRQTERENLVWFGEIERKFAKLSMTTFTYRSSSYLFYASEALSSFCNIKIFCEMHKLHISFSC